MSEDAIVAFDRIRFSCRLNMIFFRNTVFVRLPIISCYFSISLIFNLIPELLSSLSASVANNAIDAFFFISINSNPYPSIVFFDPHRYASHPFLYTGLAQDFSNLQTCSPKVRIQLSTVTLLTSKTRPIERNPNPLNRVEEPIFSNIMVWL